MTYAVPTPHIIGPVPGQFVWQAPYPFTYVCSRSRICRTGPGMTTHPVILKSPAVVAGPVPPGRDPGSRIIPDPTCRHDWRLPPPEVDDLTKSAGGTNPRLITYPNSRNWSTSASVKPIRPRREDRGPGSWAEVTELLWFRYGRRLPDLQEVVLGSH